MSSFAVKENLHIIGSSTVVINLKLSGSAM